MKLTVKKRGDTAAQVYTVVTISFQRKIQHKLCMLPYSGISLQSLSALGPWNFFLGNTFSFTLCFLPLSVKELILFSLKSLYTFYF